MFWMHDEVDVTLEWRFTFIDLVVKPLLCLLVFEL